MKRFGQFLLVIFALVCVLMTAAFAEGDVEHTSFVWGTVASLLPPVAAIVLALITKEVYSSLFLGIIVGCFLYTNGSPIDAFQDFVSRLTSNAGGNMGILMFLVILGTMVALMIRAGGSKAYGDWAVSHIKTKSGALWSTFILAIVLGVDDYFNNLTTGNVMRPVTDGHHISRAKLSYMCDATAAPVCIMMPVSSWAAAVTGIIGNEEVGFQIFLKAIPYNYYAILTLVFIVVMTCLNIDYGPMRKHENNAAKGDLYTPLWEHKGEDIFYRTDHHWTSLGAYYGYTGLATALGYTPVPLNDYTETVRSTAFYGTVFSSSGVRWVRPDTISTYVPDDGITVASHTYDNKGNPVEEPRQLYDTSFLSVKDKYSMFLGGNQPLGVVKNANNPDGPRLLIIRDSYADSLVPFLTPHFSEIHLLDLRYYKLSIADYIAQNGIDQALVLYSVPNFVTDSNLLWIAK